MLRALGSREETSERWGDRGGEGRQVGRLQLQAESESHVRQTVAMSQIFIARLQEIQRVHIPHSVLSGTVARVKQKHKYTDTRHISFICPTVPGPRWTWRRIACLAARSSRTSVCLFAELCWASCLPAWLPGCLLHVAATRGSSNNNERTVCAIDLRLFDCIRTRTLAATDADSCGCTLRLNLLASLSPCLSLSLSLCLLSGLCVDCLVHAAISQK